MESDNSFETNIPVTKFDQEVILTKQQFREYKDLFTLPIRHSIAKTIKGELPPCNESELRQKLEKYLNQSKNE